MDSMDLNYSKILFQVEFFPSIEKDREKRTQFS